MKEENDVVVGQRGRRWQKWVNEICDKQGRFCILWGPGPIHRCGAPWDP